MTIPEWIYVPSREEWMLMSMVFGTIGIVLVMCLSAFIRERRERAALVARAAALPPIRPGIDEAILPFTYSRREWLLDMENPDLTIEEITVRVVRSNGAWRLRPADPPPPTFGPSASAGAGSGLSGFSGIAAAVCAGSLLASFLDSEV